MRHPKRRLAFLVTALATAAPMVATIMSASPALACDINISPDCVGVGVGGRDADGGRTGQGGVRTGRGAPTPPDRCAKYPAGYYEDCKTWKGQGCLDLFDRYHGVMPVVAFNMFVMASGCPGVAAGAAPPPPTPAQLAERAAATFLLPHPSGHRSPSEDKDIGGYPFTYINLWTFYWTDPGTWRSLTATAEAGGNYATVTATPVSLTFDPGNGSGSVWCVGPGRPWVESDGDSAPSGQACGYQYSKVTGPGYEHPVASTQTITWRLTWMGSNKSNGTLTSKRTATNGPLNVLQVQTVNR